MKLEVNIPITTPDATLRVLNHIPMYINIISIPNTIVNDMLAVSDGNNHAYGTTRFCGMLSMLKLVFVMLVTAVPNVETAIGVNARVVKLPVVVSHPVLSHAV
jgi:hypothetical protein